VIEIRRLPGSGRVARFARLGEAALHMVRILRSLKILQVTRHTGCLREVEIFVDVAIGASARRNRVLSGERES